MEEKPQITSYPVNLLLRDRDCLVVGGGAVARRKVARLLESGARVRVVAPAAVSELEKLAAADRIELAAREFRESDLKGVFLAFFATSDAKLNLKLMQIAQRLKVLACSVDENWRHGDFITPASCTAAGVQVAVSTDGRSCRQAMAVKQEIARQLEELAGGGITRPVKPDVPGPGRAGDA